MILGYFCTLFLRTAGESFSALMKKLLGFLVVLSALSMACHSAAGDRVIIAQYFGTFTQGTNSGSFSLALGSDGVAFVNRYSPEFGNEQVAGKFTESKTGARVWTVQTSTNSFTGTAFNGVVRGKSKNFVTGATGTVQCDLPAAH